MATSRNEFTGAKLQTKPANAAYYSGWDAIFAKKETPTEDVPAETVVTEEDPIVKD